MFRTRLCLHTFHDVLSLIITVIHVIRTIQKIYFGNYFDVFSYLTKTQKL